MKFPGNAASLIFGSHRSQPSEPAAVVNAETQHFAHCSELPSLIGGEGRSISLDNDDAERLVADCERGDHGRTLTFREPQASDYRFCRRVAVNQQWPGYCSYVATGVTRRRRFRKRNCLGTVMLGEGRPVLPGFATLHDGCEIGLKGNRQP